MKITITEVSNKYNNKELQFKLLHKENRSRELQIKSDETSMDGDDLRDGLGRQRGNPLCWKRLAWHDVAQ